MHVVYVRCLSKCDMLTRLHCDTHANTLQRELAWVFVLLYFICYICVHQQHQHQHQQQYNIDKHDVIQHNIIIITSVQHMENIHATINPSAHCGQYRLYGVQNQ